MIAGSFPVVRRYCTLFSHRWSAQVNRSCLVPPVAYAQVFSPPF